MRNVFLCVFFLILLQRAVVVNTDRENSNFNSNNIIMVYPTICIYRTINMFMNNGNEHFIKLTINIFTFYVPICVFSKIP